MEEPQNRRALENLSTRKLGSLQEQILPLKNTGKTLKPELALKPIMSLGHPRKLEARAEATCLIQTKQAPQILCSKSIDFSRLFTRFLDREAR